MMPRARSRPCGQALLAAASAALVAASTGCSSARVNDPQQVAVEFSRAAAKGDDAALYAMLSPEGRRTLSRDDVRRLVADEKDELAQVGRALAAPRTNAVATARLRFADGEEATLALANGAFAVTSAGSLPGGAGTPEAALDQLRRAIARRSYAALLRALSPTTRAAIEQDLRTLVNGLEHPETAAIRTKGDASTVVVPGGHHVTLKRDQGVWRVEDFD
jgi:hypothetical protein